MIPNIWPCSYWEAVLPALDGLVDELHADGCQVEDWLDSQGLRVRYDQRGRQTLIQDRGANWHICTDGQLANLHGRLCQSSLYQPKALLHSKGRSPTWTAERWQRAWRAYIATVRIDPFAEWLCSLDMWDQTPRIDELLATVLGATPGPLATWASRALFLGPIQRARFPGSQLDQVPVLVGSQGTGKSALIRALLPPERPEWFGDDIRVGMPSKEIAEATAGRVLIEFSELVMHKFELAEQVKAMLTRRDDGQCRMAYAVQAEAIPRRWCGVATANDTGHGILPDDSSGHRRFVVIPVTGATEPVEPYIDGIRDQLWAEAVHRWSAGEFTAGAGLPRALLPAAQQIARAYERTDEIMDTRIADIPTSFVMAARKQGVSIEDISRKLGLSSTDGSPISRGTQMGVASSLKRAGWTSYREYHKGQQRRLWRAPATESSSEEAEPEFF